MVEKIYKEYHLPLELFTRMKQSIVYTEKKDINDLNEFVEDLPQKLRVEVSLFIHEDTFKKIVLLRDKDDQFKAWFCPMLKPLLITNG